MCVAVGSSVALTARSTLGEHKLLRSPALWGLVAFSLLVLAPVGGFLLWRHPDWATMYLFDINDLPFPDIAVALFYPLLAIAFFLISRYLILSSRTLIALGILAVSLLLISLVSFFGWEQLTLVGDIAAFRDDPTGMRPVVGSALGYHLAAAGGAVIVGWCGTLWRLLLLASAVRAQATEQEDQVAPPPPPPKAKPKKKSKAKKKS